MEFFEYEVIQMQTQSSTTIDEYLKLLDLVYEVAQSLEGKPSPDFRWPDCQQLATKLYFHAALVHESIDRC